jgi:hypothetical protein
MNDSYSARPCCLMEKCYHAEHRLAQRLGSGCEAISVVAGRIFRLCQRSGTITYNRIYIIFLYLALFAATASGTFTAPGETELGPAGEQPDKG